MSKIEIDFGTTGESIANDFMNMGSQDPESVIISKSEFKHLAEAIESYASFKVGEEMSGLRNLQEHVKASAHIELNPHKAFYEDAEAYFKDRDIDCDHVGKLDWSKDIWTAQVYPSTPIGFILGISNDIDALVEWAVEGAKGYGR